MAIQNNNLPLVNLSFYAGVMAGDPVEDIFYARIKLIVQLCKLEATLAKIKIRKSENGTLHPLLQSQTGQSQPPLVL